jgi:hypothetical protein
LGVSVVQGGNQDHERLLVEEVIEDVDALSAHDRLVVAKAAAHSRHDRGSGRQ